MTNLAKIMDQYLETTTTVEGVERIAKLLAQYPPVGSVRITSSEFDDIAKTLDYRMDNWCDYDLIKANGVTIGYSRGRGYYGEIWLTSEFATRIAWDATYTNLSNSELVECLKLRIADWREAAKGEDKQKLSHAIFLVRRLMDAAAARGITSEQLLEKS